MIINKLKDNNMVKPVFKPMTLKSTSTNQQKTYITDILFYGIVSALGVAVTSFCVYGYRKYTRQFNIEIVELEEQTEEPELLMEDITSDEIEHEQIAQEQTGESQSDFFD